MSELGIAVVAAFAGGLATYLLSLSAQSKANLEVRTIAIMAVRDEFADAQSLLAAAAESGGLWLPSRSLPGSAWEAYGLQLAGFLGKDDRDEVRRARSLLVSVDKSAKRIQDAAGSKGRTQDVPEHLVKGIEKLEPQLEAALAILDGALGDAKSESSRARQISVGAVIAIAAIVVVGALLPTIRGIAGGPAVTAGSIAKRLQAESPSSNRAICDESAVFEGAFRCAIDLGGCDGQLEASRDEPSCPVQKQRIYKVLADEDCFEATEMEMIEKGAPASDPPGEPEREDFRAGCIED